MGTKNKSDIGTKKEDVENRCCSQHLVFQYDFQRLLSPFILILILVEEWIKCLLSEYYIIVSMDRQVYFAIKLHRMRWNSIHNSADVEGHEKSFKDKKSIIDPDIQRQSNQWSMRWKR